MKAKKNIASFVGTNVLLGVGADVVQKTGGNASAISTVSGFMPTVGTALGGKMVIDELKKLQRVGKK